MPLKKGSKWERGRYSPKILMRRWWKLAFMFQWWSKSSWDKWKNIVRLGMRLLPFCVPLFVLFGPNLMQRDSNVHFKAQIQCIMRLSLLWGSHFNKFNSKTSFYNFPSRTRNNNDVHASTRSLFISIVAITHVFFYSLLWIASNSFDNNPIHFYHLDRDEIKFSKCTHFFPRQRKKDEIIRFYNHN